MSDQPTVFLASRNAKKLAEMQRILAGHVPEIRVLGLDDVPSYDEPAETEPTFEGNARIKALAAVAATGLPSLSDDSGLCVDALNGMPGVLSARWAGLTDADPAEKDLANNRLLLAQLADVPDARRTARFHCSVVFVMPTPGGVVEEVAEGVMPGRVIREMRGAGGFGYDVLFAADPDPGSPATGAPADDRTTAELPAHEKDRLSHRGKALRSIAPRVVAALAST